MSDIPPELQNALKERYEILRELGRGGMAIVYAARDVKMNREVAIKVLLPDLAMAMGPERFSREIEIAAHLSNPHILAVFDQGQAAGQLYYVMPLIRGESLRARLDREKQLPIEESLRLSIEVAEALDYAHKQGVIHRDIKPENILLEGGHAIIADFGIARAASSIGEGNSLTQTGMALGTASYMSPEQVAAEKDIDGRSDIYSLACVTYEMLAGQPPFTGPNMAAIMARQALEMPPSLKVIRQTIPDEIEGVVFQALAKSRADRFETAGDYADALQDCMALAPTVSRRTAQPRVTSATLARRKYQKRRKFLLAGVIAVPAIAAVLLSAKLLSKGPGVSNAVAGRFDPKNVAVLYFDDESNGKLAYLADGLTETLIDQLENVQAINVISKDGVARFRGKNPPNDSVASVLSVGTIVRGSVADNGERVGINLRIVDGNGGGDQDRRGFEFPQGDLLAVRNAVVDSVRAILSAYVGTEIRTRELRAGTTNGAAWTLTQRAEKHRKDAIAAVAARDTTGKAAQDFATADSLLTQAQQLDRRWSAPLAMRSLVSFNRAQSARTDVGRWIDQGIALADSAIALDPNNVDAWEARGRLHYLRWTRNVVTDANDARRALTAAETDLAKATELDKSRASAWNTLSNVRSDNDDFTGAKIAATRAWEEDTFLANIGSVINNLYRTSYNLEQVSDARKWCDEGFKRFPRNYVFTRCRLWMRTLAGVTPNVDSAWTDAKEYADLSPPALKEMSQLEGQLVVAGTLARASRTDASKQQLLADSARRILARVRAAATEAVDPEHELMGLEAVMWTLFETKEGTDEAIAILRRYVSGNPGHREGLARSQSWWWRPLKPLPAYQALVAGR